MSITDEEVMNMPRRDGTGPRGPGVTRRRGLGVCNGVKSVSNGTGLGLGLGLGLGYRRGIGKVFVADQTVPKTQKESLQEEKELLKSRLDIISKQLES
jgi:hypothetical protein